MANNVAITAGSGTNIATDQLGTGEHVQIVKLMDGTEDGSGRIAGDATNGLDVDVTRVIPGTGATSLGKAEDAAHASGDTGVMALGVRNDNVSVLPASANGDYSYISVDSRGALFAQINGSSMADGTTAVPVGSGVVNGGSSGHAVGVIGLLYNGASKDLPRANVEGTALASAARTASTQSADIVNYNGRGVLVFVDVTAVTATPSITVAIEGKDPVSGKYFTLLTGAALTAVSTQLLVVYPGVTETANADVATPLPRTWRVNVTHADADSITYSIGYAIIL